MIAMGVNLDNSKALLVRDWSSRCRKRLRPARTSWPGTPRMWAAGFGAFQGALAEQRDARAGSGARRSRRSRPAGSNRRDAAGSCLVLYADRNYDAPAVRSVRLYTDDDGQSRFEDWDFAFASKDFAPPAPPVDVSEAVEASAFMMLRAPAGWTDPMHPAPARQFFIVLAGSWEVSAGGETACYLLGTWSWRRTPPGRDTQARSSRIRWWPSSAFSPLRF
jgi:hypothetical protein